MKNYKTVTIITQFTGINTFSVPIHISFNPDFVKVNHVSINGNYAAAGIPEVFIIKSSLVGYETLTHFSLSAASSTIQGATFHPNTKFKLYNNPVRGTFDFQLLNSLGNVPTSLSTATLNLAITLEFYEL